MPFTTWIDYAQMADGVLATTSHALESAAINACEAFCNMIPTGIAISNRAWTGSALEEGSVKTFMDKQAEKSVLVISFGCALPLVPFLLAPYSPQVDLLP